MQLQEMNNRAARCAGSFGCRSCVYRAFRYMFFSEQKISDQVGAEYKKDWNAELSCRYRGSDEGNNRMRPTLIEAGFAWYAMIKKHTQESHESKTVEFWLIESLIGHSNDALVRVGVLESGRDNNRVGTIPPWTGGWTHRPRALLY